MIQVLIPILLTTLTGSAGQAGFPSIDLAFGKPVHINAKGYVVDYDGKDAVVVRTTNHSTRLKAMVPAHLTVSPTGRYIVHNFGNGSGQVYDIRVYALRNGRLVNERPFKRKVVAFAHSRTSCRAQADQISYLAEAWLSPSALRIRTEDWTRRPGCEHIDRKWTFEL